MELPSPTFVFGVLVVLYLSSFIVFAILRIITGISIQRIGYLSLRRLAYTPKDGIKVEIRGLGLSLHRPTFSRPTWLSIKVSELAVTIDVKELEGAKPEDHDEDSDEASAKAFLAAKAAKLQSKNLPSRRTTFGAARSETWKQLTKIKERIKRLHRNLHWLRMVDVVATNSTVNVVDVGTVQLGSFTIAVDTRRRMSDRARFFFQTKADKRRQKQPAEWIMTLNGVLFTPHGGESVELVDAATLNIHGFLYEQLDGLRDAAIALKLGRVHIPYNEIQSSVEHFEKLKAQYSKGYKDVEAIKVDMDKFIQEVEEPGSTDEDLMQAVSDSKEFFSSILRGIKEVQFAVSFVSLTRKLQTVKTSTTPLLMNASMKEVGIDLHRLDPKTPAHRMYFPSTDIAHEALAAALSISVGLDDGHGKPERVIYIPMATTTVRTTLPSKTVELANTGSAEQRNANILFANSVVTSPSVDLVPKHLPIFLALLKPNPKAPRAHAKQRHMLISRLLPKSNIKFSMHEPVIRVALPSVHKTDDPDDFDLIISSISSISLDIESSHSAEQEINYSLASSMRIQTHHLYYQTCQGNRFNLIDTESFDLKIQLAASPDVAVVASGHLQTFAIRMVRPEITDGLRQIVRQLRPDIEPEKRRMPKSHKPHNFLRALPPWLLHFNVQMEDFNVEVAGLDELSPNITRGVALQLDSWSAEYRAQRPDHTQGRSGRRRASSRTLVPEVDLLRSSPNGRKKSQNDGDGRRIAIHVRGLEAFIVESADKWEADPFVHLPRFEVALSTSSDNQGPVLHINSHVKTLLLQYSLFRHYAIGVAVMVLRKAFAHERRTPSEAPDNERSPSLSPNSANIDRLMVPSISPDSPVTGQMGEFPQLPPKELVAIDIKASLIQIKAEMPSDPPVMLRVYNMEAGRHRWAYPFFQAKLVRMFVGAPRMRGVWARLISIMVLRIDYRKAKRKHSGGGYSEEKMIDIAAEAIRLGVPHEVIIHKITDNFMNVFKASKQLHHCFKTGTNEYILDKKPEGPKNVPRISIRTRTLSFEVEDGAFEWKLGMIYRAGRIEQLQRLAREEAFRVKVKRIQEEEFRKNNSRQTRNQSAMARGRAADSKQPGLRSKSEDGRRQQRRRWRSRGDTARGRTPRYNPDEVLGMSGHAHVSTQEARQKLDEHNSKSWKTRIDRHYIMGKNGMKEMRSLFYGSDFIPDDLEDTEKILEVPQRPALMALLITDLHVVVDKPSFPMSQLPDFLHKIGKGMPKDMQYGLLLPMNISIGLSEARISLRDYPLPFLHVPAMKPGQSTRLPALALRTDFVLAEEFRGIESMRKVIVQITPPTDPGPGGSNQGSFAIDVRRTIGPVKSYSDMRIDINSSSPTRITWGPSYQPAIQDLMMAVESFTKPQLDPSERVGFWDKVRLTFHSRVQIAWKGDGDMHLALKGTRDPYQVTGNGAGLLMCWRNDVRWNIHMDDDPKKFMTVESGEYVLAIPDYSHQVREAHRSIGEDESMVSEDIHRSGTAFKKVAMKLSGNVQWMAGLVLERALVNGERNFDFIPHYDIMLKAPQYAKSQNGLPYDAFRGFRSQHIHLSISVKAPVDREWTSSNPQLSRSYNTVHLTPRFFTHFFAWWSLFSGPMSLPIRQGSLWPGRGEKSKKFGRHLATIKYSLLLAPVFFSHIYKHKDAEDYSENTVSATGIKVRFDSFMLDMHQRREEFNTQGGGLKTRAKTSGMKIHQAQLDLAAADIRAVSASIKGTTAEAIQQNALSTLIAQGEDDAADLSNFTIPDNDFTWIDMDDFVELDWILPSEPNPETKILPLAYAPRITYVRQTDIGGVIDGDPDRSSPFGHEPTHFCTMREDDDPQMVQSQLFRTRLQELHTQIDVNAQNMEEVASRLAQVGEDKDAKANLDTLSKYSSVLREKKSFLESMLKQMVDSTPKDNRNGRTKGLELNHEASSLIVAAEGSHAKVHPGAEFASDFKNRFVVHNMQLKWNNLLRNIILRYSHQVSQRRGFVYYMSRPAVKFILDIVEEQAKAKMNKTANTSSPDAGNASTTATPAEPSQEASADIESRIKQILQDGRKFVDADSSGGKDGPCNVSMEDLTGGIAEEFAPQSSYHVRLIAPQIQLQSDKNKKHVVMVTAKGMELKVIEVMEKARISDVVSGLVQRRFMVTMDSTQFFVTHQKWFTGQLLIPYSGQYYGTPAGSSWPPWVPVEVMFDFQTDPFGFKRVVQKTSAMLRYDKYNTLRLKYNDEINTEGTHITSHDSTESKMDNLWVEFPQARALCNSSQYYAIYVIVLDLLMYSEPLEKTRSERLEKIILASDFSDLRGTPEMVVKLQERIRQLQDIKTHFQINSKYLDKKGWEERLLLERDLTACEDELFFMMKAITTSQRKKDSASQSNALLRWSIHAAEIVWHLVKDNNEPLVELQLRNVEYDRTDNSDGSHINLMQVGKILGLNLLPDSLYPEMIAPYFEAEKSSTGDLGDQQMIRIYWHMLEAIAGIPVMDHFEVNLFPLKIQLERELGKKLFEYVFPGIDGEKALNNDGAADTPLMLKQGAPGDIEEEDADDSISTSGQQAGSEKDFATRTGSLELRLRPTLTSEARSTDGNAQKNKPASLHSGEGHGFRLFGGKSATKKPSYDSLRSASTPKPGINRSATVASSQSDTKKGSRFNIRGKGGAADEKANASDDLTKMITRASNYMTFAYIKVPSVVLCLSYKGKGDRNLEDVHDFVFRLPTLEYRNKTWSNLDLALALKSRVIKALISHTGAIIGNKFSRHRPNPAQQNKLRELATSSVVLAQPALGNGGDNSDDSVSLFGTSPADYSRSPPRSLRGSQTNIPVPARSTSPSSSIASSRSYRATSSNGNDAHRITSVPRMLVMTTPPTPIERTDPSSGLGIDIRRPGSSTNSARNSPRPDSRGSSTLDLDKDRRRTGGGFLRGRLNAFTSRLKEREGSDTRSIQDSSEKEDDNKSDRKLNWSTRTKTG